MPQMLKVNPAGVNDIWYLSERFPVELRKTSLFAVRKSQHELPFPISQLEKDRQKGDD